MSLQHTPTALNSTEEFTTCGGLLETCKDGLPSCPLWQEPQVIKWPFELSAPAWEEPRLILTISSSSKPGKGESAGPGIMPLSSGSTPKPYSWPIFDRNRAPQSLQDTWVIDKEALKATGGLHPDFCLLHILPVSETKKKWIATLWYDSTDPQKVQELVEKLRDEVNGK